MANGAPFDKRKAVLTYSFVEALTVPKVNPSAGITQYVQNPAVRAAWADKINGPFLKVAAIAGYSLQAVTGQDIAGCGTIRELMQLIYGHLTLAPAPARIAAAFAELADTRADDSDSFTLDDDLTDDQLEEGLLFRGGGE